MRFGLFWRSLRFDLEKSCDVINAAALLHNFLVDTREDTDEDSSYFANLSYSDVDRMQAAGGNDPLDADGAEDYTFPIVSDNNEPKPRGRKSTDEVTKHEQGRILRDEICSRLYSAGKSRQINCKMRVNHLGHVYTVV